MAISGPCEEHGAALGTLQAREAFDWAAPLLTKMVGLDAAAIQAHIAALAEVGMLMLHSQGMHVPRMALMNRGSSENAMQEACHYGQAAEVCILPVGQSSAIVRLLLHGAMLLDACNRRS